MKTKGGYVPPFFSTGGGPIKCSHTKFLEKNENAGGSELGRNGKFFNFKGSELC
jgi:hypothetical protein